MPGTSGWTGMIHDVLLGQMSHTFLYWCLVAYVQQQFSNSFRRSTWTYLDAPSVAPEHWKTFRSSSGLMHPIIPCLTLQGFAIQSWCYPPWLRGTPTGQGPHRTPSWPQGPACAPPAPEVPRTCCDRTSSVADRYTWPPSRRTPRSPGGRWARQALGVGKALDQWCPTNLEDPVFFVKNHVG